jgi:hypothetical protein
MAASSVSESKPPRYRDAEEESLLMYRSVKNISKTPCAGYSDIDTLIPIGTERLKSDLKEKP